MGNETLSFFYVMFDYVGSFCVFECVREAKHQAINNRNKEKCLVPSWCEFWLLIFMGKLNARKSNGYMRSIEGYRIFMLWMNGLNVVCLVVCWFRLKKCHSLGEFLVWCSWWIVNTFGLDVFGCISVAWWGWYTSGLLIENGKAWRYGS